MVEDLFKVSPETQTRLAKNIGNFLGAAKLLLALLLMMRFYKLGQLMKHRAAAREAAKAGGSKKTK